jgi:succinate dehydrogenase/fumarate reductase flavoprotein subunit
VEKRLANQRWDQEVDVAVVGSGGAGLTAAVLAHDNGARVTVLERSDKIGGTTAVSGGGIWVPLNHHMSEIGAQDTREEAIEYCKRLAAGRSSDELLETFVDTAHVMLTYLEEHTPVRYRACPMPDYRPEDPGAKTCGRTLDPELFSKAELGEWADKLRPSPLLFVPIKIEESFMAFSQPKSLPVGEIVQRMKDGLVASGNALIGRLLRGCLDRKIEFQLETRARELVREDGRIVGLRVEQNGGDVFIRARGGVVLASGGFEWNAALRDRFLPGPISHSCSPHYNEGDALIMAQEVGADIGNMTEAWVYPGAIVPGEEHEGHPVSRWIVGERTLPHAIMVNRHGERFVNEGINYNDMSKALYNFDPGNYELRNLPCWLIVDSQYRERYPIMTVMPDDPDPDWLPKEDTLAALATRVGIDAEALAATAERWNGFVRDGKDRDFGRGEGHYERWMGDPTAPHPNLGTLERGPFFALSIDAHSSGTKGGPRTNTRGQVLDVRGNVIGGLYAAGNAMAGVSGPGYFGGGGTIGLAMTWGYLCGIDAAKQAKAR